MDKHGSGSSTDFPIGIRNGLISPVHRKKMGNAIWEFLWLVEHVTEEYQTSRGEIRGKVLGGTLITADRIAGDYTGTDEDTDEEISVSPDTIRNHLSALSKAGYITCRRGTNGFYIEVRNSKKWPGRFSTPDPSPPSQPEDPSLSRSVDQAIGESENRRIDKNTETPNLRMPDSPIASNDIAVGKDIAEDNAPPPAAEERTREAAEIWAIVIGMVTRTKPARYLAALRQAVPVTIEGNALVVKGPPDAEDLALVQELLPVLVNSLRVDKRYPVHLTILDPNTEARAGP